MQFDMLSDSQAIVLRRKAQKRVCNGILLHLNASLRKRHEEPGGNAVRRSSTHGFVLARCKPKQAGVK